jgi:hypothetical protein
MTTGAVASAHFQTELPEFALQIGDEGPVANAELAEYLLVLNKVYAVALEVIQDSEAQTESVSISEGASLVATSRAYSDDVTNLVTSLRQRLNYTEFDPSDWNLGDAQITISGMTKSSPLMIVGMCQMTALCLAVIISGGKVDLRKLQFTVNALGDGLRKLRAAFAPNARSRSGPRARP